VFDQEFPGPVFDQEFPDPVLGQELLGAVFGQELGTDVRVGFGVGSLFELEDGHGHGPPEG
jgi:hypothetical protein